MADKLTSNYKGVTPYRDRKWKNKILFIARKMHKGVDWQKHCKTERAAAIAYDIRLIELGLPPVNILKPK